jgi:hypothetical protein
MGNEDWEVGTERSSIGFQSEIIKIEFLHIKETRSHWQIYPDLSIGNRI